MSLDGLLIHICDIETLTQDPVAVDDYGNPTETWPDSYTDQECRLQASGGREIKVGAEVMISDWTLYLPAGITVDEQDRISNIRLRADGTVIDAGIYEILLIEPFSNGSDEQHKRLALRQVN